MSELEQINKELLAALKLMLINATVFGCDPSHLAQAKAVKKRVEYHNMVLEADKFHQQKSEDLLHEAQMEGGSECY